MVHWLTWWVVIFSALCSTSCLEEGDKFVCQKQETHLTTIRVTYSKHYQIHTFTWCLAIPPRCSRYRIAYTTGYKTEPKIITRTVNSCCEGYVLTDDKSRCIPFCSSPCIHGTCVGPEECQCQPGFSGLACNVTFCSSPCIHGTCVGPEECQCQPGFSGLTCNVTFCSSPCIHGTCVGPEECQCQPGFSGLTCNVSNNCEGMLKAIDCADVLRTGHNRSGVYEIWPMSRVTEGKSVHVYCDMDTDGGGWTVIQRRGDFQRSKDYFFKDWKSYREGFGDLNKDFWLGNDNIYALTNQKLYSVRFDLKDVQQSKRYALYDKFWTDDENHKYTLHISDYSGDSGDSMLSAHNNQKFSTKDQDNDSFREVNCAASHKAGWWYNSCHNSNLNGIYYKGKHGSYGDGVNWHSWKGFHESLEWTEIKIRPKNFGVR